MLTSLFILSILGLFLSCYALYTEWKTQTIKHYKALCDFATHISCTKAFTSPYGKLLGTSNAVYGLFFYILLALLALYDLPTFIFSFSILACLGTIILAYLSYYKMRNFCLVCSSIYAVNILLLIMSYRAL